MKANHHRALIAAARAMSLDELLRKQDGVVLRAQALAAGMSDDAADSLVRRGLWKTTLPGVYTVRDAVTPFAAIRAPWMWAGEGAVVGGLAVFFARGLIEHEPSTIDVYVPGSRSRQGRPGVTLRRGRLDRRDIRWVRNIPMTTIARSGLDLARWGADDDRLDLAMRRRATTGEELRAALSRLTASPTYGRALAAAEEAIRNPWSPPERRLHAGLTDAGISGWVANRPVKVSIGVVRPDLAFTDIKLAVEVEGRRYHDEAADPKAFERGHRRAQALIDAGWTVLQFTAKQIADDLPGVLRTIRATIARLGASLPA